METQIKHLDITLSVHDEFLEQPSSDLLKYDRLEGQITTCESNKAYHCLKYTPNIGVLVHASC